MRNLPFAFIFFIKNIKDIIYPQTCLLCGKYVQDSICEKCFKILKEKSIGKIKYKANNSFYFSKHIYCFKYEGIIRNKILDYKFNNKPYICELFVKIILKDKKICRFLESYDIIIPVPIHEKRKIKRGYNQSELIAKKLAKNFNNLELNENNLIKIKNNIAQSTLTKEQRILNTKNVYKIQNKQKIKDKKVIIFDDIYTTGSTVNECAKVLKQNGAKDIIIITIAKD